MAKEREMEIEQHDDECKHGVFPPSSCRLCNPPKEVIWIGESESD